MGDFDEANARSTALLKGQKVKFVRQDSRHHIMVQFENGPELSIGIPRQRRKELDISICATLETSAEWMEMAESSDLPPPPRRRAKA
ncbi:hypothetical protein AADZ90_006805 [Aestuariibius sp. 2305UL40-4]|uniref:hypothetical protein n=1 Tax=Aestuariibius violaceus TaxID=3234132 RepID=UPI00345F0082